MILKEVVENKSTYLFSFIVSFLSVLIAVWLGIFTTPLSHIAFFWPANAILLGLLLRFPHYRNIGTFLGALFAYLLAELAAGSGLLITLVLTAANYISVGLGLLLFLKLNQYFLGTKFSYNHLYLYVISTVIASGISSLLVVLILPYVPDNFFKVNSFAVSFLNWWSSELFNYAIILPIIVSFPKYGYQHYFSFEEFNFNRMLYLICPLFGLVLSLVIVQNFFSQSILLYPLLALIWAAGVYRFFTFAVICAITSLILYYILSDYNFYFNDNIFDPIFSIRIGLLIMILCALTVASMNIYHRRLYVKMKYSESFEALHHTIDEQSFLKACQMLIKTKQQYPLTFIKIEIDQLQKIHDQYGKLVVDQILEKGSQVIREKLRTEDLFCRIEHEQFILLMQKTSICDVIQIAKRIQEEVNNITLEMQDGEYLKISISLGLSHCQNIEDSHMQQAISYADEALHQAKKRGFNQLHVHKNMTTAL